MNFFKSPVHYSSSITDFFFASNLVIFVFSNDLGGWCQTTKISTIFHENLAHKVQFGQHMKNHFQ
jgi:hypothetical protein